MFFGALQINFLFFRNYQIKLGTIKAPLEVKRGWGSYDYHRAWFVTSNPSGNPSQPPLNLRGGA